MFGVVGMVVAVSMPEEMHQRTGEQKQVGENANDVLKMLTCQQRQAEEKGSDHPYRDNASPAASEVTHDSLQC